MDSSAQIVANQISQSVNSLAEGMNIPGEQVYSVLVRQNMVEGMAGFLVTLIVLAIALFCFKAAMKAGGNMVSPEGRPTPKFVGVAVTAILLAIAATFFGKTITTNTSKMINPQYHAITEIREQAGL